MWLSRHYRVIRTRAVKWDDLKTIHLNCAIQKNTPTSGLLGKDSPIETSLWFTTLPAKQKNGFLLQQKKKLRKIDERVLYKCEKDRIPIITCKNPKFNKYKGDLPSGKFDPVPLASKGWFHRKSRGDYFTLHPTLNTNEHPAFFRTKNDPDVVSFIDCGIVPSLAEMLQQTHGILKPTTIQWKGILPILQGKNTLLVGETGCGKTLSYLLPFVQRVSEWKALGSKSPIGMIIVPSRELAIQVGKWTAELCRVLNLECVTYIGGHTKRLILNQNIDACDVIVGTLGCISKLSTNRLVDVRNVRQLVLDEADTLLDDSFNEKLMHLLRRFVVQYEGPANILANPNESNRRGTQLCFASATMPTSMNNLLGEIISVDSLVKVSTAFVHRVLPHVEQTFFRMRKLDKSSELLQITKRLHANQVPTMIFSNQTLGCEWVRHFLVENGIPCELLHSRLQADERLGKYLRFHMRGKDDNLNMISCTDITSRGIDTTRVRHIINFDFPLYMADYVHRCGRTARINCWNEEGGKCGITNMISSRREIPLVNAIEQAARTNTALHNVNNNITKIIKYKAVKEDEQMKKEEMYSHS